MNITPLLTSRAAAAGLQLVVVGDRVEARKGKKVLSFNSDPDKALTKALERVGEQRTPVVIEAVIPSASRKKKVVAVDLPGAEPVAPLPIVAADPETPVKVSASIIKAKYKDKYKKNGDYSCGDLIATELREFIVSQVKGRLLVDLAKLKTVATTNNVWKETYVHLNPGQQRMTIGNRLRWRYADGEIVDIGGAIFQMEFKD